MSFFDSDGYEIMLNDGEINEQKLLTFMMKKVF